MSAKLLGLALAAAMPSQTAKLVLIGLCDAAEGDGSSAYPSVARLAVAAQCTDRAVQKWLKVFRETAFKGGRSLIAVVRPGGGGPGSMTEYALDVELLVELEAKGWDALAETAADDQVDGEAPNAPPFAKGEPSSPLSKGEPGGAKGESGSIKGEPADSPDPSLDPPFRPGESAGARGAETGKAKPSAAHPTPEEALEAFRKIFPDFALQSQGMALSALSPLTPRQRQEAIDGFPAFHAFHREKMGKRPLPHLHVYIAEKRHQDVPAEGKAAAAAAGASGHAAAFSRTWWAIFHRFVAASPQAFANRDSAPAQTLRKKISLATSSAIGWSLPAEQLAKLDAWAVDGLVKAPVGGEDAARWRMHYGALGVVMPIPDKVEWIWLPVEEPAFSGGVQ